MLRAPDWIVWRGSSPSDLARGEPVALGRVDASVFGEGPKRGHPVHDVSDDCPSCRVSPADPGGDPGRWEIQWDRIEGLAGRMGDAVEMTAGCCSATGRIAREAGQGKWVGVMGTRDLSEMLLLDEVIAVPDSIGHCGRR